MPGLAAGLQPCALCTFHWLKNKNAKYDASEGTFSVPDVLSRYKNFYTQRAEA